MKAGTTTLFRDLGTQPKVFFPFHKEPHNLCYDEVFTPRGLARYARLFHKACAGQLIGEASTGYAKLPTIPEVAGRARQVLGPELKIIYSVREPVARALSHHFHMHLAGLAPADFGETLRQLPDLINFGRYAMQLGPWIEAFDREQIHVVHFETYAGGRMTGLSEMCKFLGIVDQPELIQQERSFNAAQDKRKIPPWLASTWRKVIWTPFYRNTVRPLVPDRLILMLKKTLLRPVAVPPSPPAPAVIDLLIDAFRDDAERLRQIMGWDKPVWDFEKVRAKYLYAEHPSGAIT